jgi:hypothetical protein
MTRLPFSRQEYAGRLDRTRRAMTELGVEVLVASDPSNMAWLTGYDGWSFYTFQAVILTLDDDPVYWGRQQDTNGARRTVWMDADHIVPYPDEYVQSTVRHPMQHLARVLADRGLAGRSIGVELDNYYYSAAAHRALTASLDRSDLVDATGLVNWRRAVKSPQELRYMEVAASIVERVYERVRETVRPGVRKNDLVAEIFHAAISGTPEHGGDYPAIVPLLPTGPTPQRPTSHGTTIGSSAGPGPSSSWPAATAVTMRRCAAPPTLARRRLSSSLRKPHCWRGSRPGSTSPALGTGPATWPTPSTTRSAVPVSSATAAVATRSASATHPTGASARSASARPTRRCSKRG